MITTLLPIFNLAGAYLARYIYQKCQSNETRAASVFFGLSTLSLFILRICGHISIFFDSGSLCPDNYFYDGNQYTLCKYLSSAL